MININTSLDSINKKIVFIGLLLFITLFWYFSFEGYYGYDDLKYCLYAFDVYERHLPFEDTIFSQRIGFYLPISLFYLLFGVNNFSTTLWPLLLTLVTAVYIYKSFKDQPAHALLASIFFGLNFYTIFFSNKIYPDVALACFGFLSIVVLYKRDLYNMSFKGAFIFIGLVSWAVLCKETIVYLFPFYLIVFINDVIQKKNYYFWRYTTAFVMAFLLIFSVFNYIFFQEVFHRTQLIADGHYSVGSYYDKSFWVLLKRITYEPIQMLVDSEMAIVLIFALPFFLQVEYRKIYQIDSFIDFWGKALIIILLMFWFSSTSYRYYNPMSLQPRMMLLMIPVASILAAYVLLNSNHKRILFFAFAFFISAAWQYYIHSPNSIVYGSLFVVCLFWGISETSTKRTVLAKVSKIIIVFILLAHPVYSMVKKKNNPELTGKRSLQELLQKKKENVHVKKVF